MANAVPRLRVRLDNAVLVMIIRTVNTVLRLRMRMVNAVQRLRDNGQLAERQKWEWSLRCSD